MSPQVQIVGLEEDSSEFVCRNTFDHPYPTTKIMWIPDTKGAYPDLLATSGDYLRIWRVRGPIQSPEPTIPLYSFYTEKMTLCKILKLPSSNWLFIGTELC